MKTHLFKLEELLAQIQGQRLTGSDEIQIGGCYISDLLSDVLARAQPGVLWVTIQTHHNVISVAATKDIAAVLFTCDRRPDAGIIAEAEEQGIALLSTPLSTFEAAGKLWEAGLR
jgi:predicted transcriptional regulator